MPVIQNQINLYINANGQLVPGSEPINFLYRNNLNRNIFFVITPLSQAAIVKLIFKNTSLNKQGYVGVALATTQTGKSITDKEVSYYNLVKDWNVFKYIPNSSILTKFPSTVTGSIALTVSITEPDLNDTTKYKYKGALFIDIPTTILNAMEKGDYYNCAGTKILLTGDTSNINILGEGFPLYNGDKIVCLDKTSLGSTYTIIRALITQSTTEPLQFIGNPSLEDDDFEYSDIGDISLLNSIISKQTEQTMAVIQLQYYVSTLNSIIIPFNSRLDQIESTISILNIDDKVDKATTINGKSLETNIELDASEIPFYHESWEGANVGSALTDLIDFYGALDENKANKDEVEQQLELLSETCMDDINTVANNVVTLEQVVSTKQDKKPNGATDLIDSNDKINTIYIPDSILGQLNYQGTFSGNTLPIATTKGQYWVYNGAGATIDGVEYMTGDWAVYNGTSFDNIHNTDAVQSVAGKTGAIILDTDDIVGLEDVLSEKVNVDDYFTELNKKADDENKVDILGAVDQTDIESSGRENKLINGLTINEYVQSQKQVVFITEDQLSLGEPIVNEDVSTNLLLNIDQELDFGKQYLIPKAYLRRLFNTMDDDMLGYEIRVHAGGYRYFLTCNKKKNGFSFVSPVFIKRYFSDDAFLIFSPFNNEKHPIASAIQGIGHIQILNKKYDYSYDSTRYAIAPSVGVGFPNSSSFIKLVNSISSRGLTTYNLSSINRNISLYEPVCILRKTVLAGATPIAPRQVSPAAINAFSHYIKADRTGNAPSLEVSFTPPYQDFNSTREVLETLQEAIYEYVNSSRHYPLTKGKDLKFTIGFSAKRKWSFPQSGSIWRDEDREEVGNFKNAVGIHNNIADTFEQLLTLKMDRNYWYGRGNRRMALYVAYRAREGTRYTWYPILFFKPYFDAHNDPDSFLPIKGIFRIEPATIAHKGVVERKKKSL